ncbi:DUF4397 domain-containing protein [Bacillus solimangrovi]|uniref:DUF4397 domain-containing protein n=1 Tax=Bacillus solimangrovi TaxID=1305675 RepID=A0A1E5LGS7_9BACI|nr:DUF4397 domain-containing protein [Bacillus solimangrovi]OEH93256.1 hypothetical protein BFG57_12705 [Bacillus solimangrovi]
MKKTISLIISFLILSFVVVTANATFAKEVQNTSMVRIIHASPDAPAVDIVIDGEIVVENAAFKAVTDYLTLSAGEHEVKIYATGTEDEQDPVIEADITTDADKAYTVAAVNTVDNIELVISEDDLALTEGMTKIRVGHFSPDAPPVNVGLKDDKVVFEDVSFKDITDFVELEADTYNFEVVTSDNEQPVLDLSGTKLDKNTVYSVYAINMLDSIEPLIVTYVVE